MNEEKRVDLLAWIAYHRETQVRLYREPDAAPLRAEMHRCVCETLQRVLAGDLAREQAEAWFLEQMKPSRARSAYDRDTGMQWVLEMAHRCQCEDGMGYIARHLRAAIARDVLDG